VAAWATRVGDTPNLMTQHAQIAEHNSATARATVPPSLRESSSRVSSLLDGSARDTFPHTATRCGFMDEGRLSFASHSTPRQSCGVAVNVRLYSSM
jgi:hypothetical protein